MNWADWAIIAIIAISSLISIKRGFIKEALSLIVWVVAFFVALTFKTPFSLLLVDHIHTPSVRDLVAYGVLFAATLIVGALVNFLLGELVRMTGLSGTDRLFGMIFGCLRGFLIVMAALVFVPSILPVDQDPWWQESVLIPQLLEFEGRFKLLYGQISSFIMQFLN